MVVASIRYTSNNTAETVTRFRHNY